MIQTIQYSLYCIDVGRFQKLRVGAVTNYEVMFEHKGML